MNRSTKIILIIIASILILGGIGAAVFAIVSEGRTSGSGEASDGTTAPLHDDIEYLYNEDGTLKRELYYKNNEYNGKTDYYYTDENSYTTTFDKDGKEIASSRTEFNVVGSVRYIESYENHLLKETVEYDYYDDLVSPSKKTVKTYIGDDMYAEKTYFAENGKRIRFCTYLNGEFLTDIYYDENGNTIENGGETGEE